MVSEGRPVKLSDTERDMVFTFAAHHMYELWDNVLNAFKKHNPREPWLELDYTKLPVTFELADLAVELPLEERKDQTVVNIILPCGLYPQQAKFLIPHHNKNPLEMLFRCINS